MLHNGLSPAGAEKQPAAARVQWTMQQQERHQQNCVFLPNNISTELGSMMPLFHGFLDSNLASAEVFDLQDHKPDTFLGVHDLPTFGDLSLAAKVVARNSSSTSSDLDEMDNCFPKTSSCQISIKEDKFSGGDDVGSIKHTDPNSIKDSLTTKTEADDEIVAVEAKMESKPKKRTRAVTTSSDTSKENSKASAVHKPNYIHVRARRGQATDSHSLAERARREKISKKMKYLQDLVPGCSKIIGKSGVLDEIINYVQSLQRQVEFLSMKLATQNPRLGFNVDDFSDLEIHAHAASFPAAPMSSASANLAELQLNPGQRVTTDYELEKYASQNPVEKTTSSPVSIPELYNIDSPCFTQVQPLPNWDCDLLSLEDGVLDQEQ